MTNASGVSRVGDATHIRVTVARCDNVANQPISPDFPINHSITHIISKELASSSAPSSAI